MGYRANSSMTIQGWDGGGCPLSCSPAILPLPPPPARPPLVVNRAAKVEPSLCPSDRLDAGRHLSMTDRSKADSPVFSPCPPLGSTLLATPAAFLEHRQLDVRIRPSPFWHHS
jgi:hypothetical protein